MNPGRKMGNQCGCRGGMQADFISGWIYEGCMRRGWASVQGVVKSRTVQLLKGEIEGERPGDR